MPTATDTLTNMRAAAKSRRRIVDVSLLDWEGARIAVVIPAGSAGSRVRSLVAELPLTPADDFDGPADLVLAPAVRDGLDQLARLLDDWRFEGGSPISGVFTSQPTAPIDFPVDLRLPWSADWCWPQIQFALQQRRAAAASAGSRLQSLEQELELIKVAIVHNISHELNTPLLQIKSAVNQIERASEHDAYISDLSDYANQAVRRLEALVARVLRLARGIDIRLDATAPADVVNLALRQIKTSWEHRDQSNRVFVEIDPDLPVVVADRQALGVLLELLVDNALKFSHHEVWVTARAITGGVMFAVADRGVGIPDTERAKIFDLFYQVDSGSTRRVNGAGIGLTIAAQIAQRHGTHITVSDTDGIGSVFSLVLPAAAEHSR